MVDWETKAIKTTFDELKDELSFTMKINLLAHSTKNKAMFTFCMNKKDLDKDKIIPTEVRIGVLNGERTKDGKNLLSVIKSNDDFKSLSEEAKKDLKTYLKQRVCEEIDKL